MDEKEVDLRDYIKLIFGNKKLIFGLFLLGIIAAIGFNYAFVSKDIIYKGKTLLEIGSKDEGTLIEQPKQLLEKINQGIYGEVNDDIVVLNPAGTNLIEIKIEGNNQEKIKNILEGISGAIVNNHNEEINVKKEIFNNKINEAQSKIALLKQQEKDIKSGVSASDRQITSFLLKNDLIMEEQKIENFKEDLANIQSTEIISHSDAMEIPSNQKLFNIIMGGLTGLFTGIFLVFLLVWWRKSY